MKYNYVYRITNNVKHKHYYGVRSCDCLPILDLGVKYFSSSRDKDFLNEQKLTPDVFKYKIIKVFSSRLEALKLEILLHKKFEVGKSKSFYNKSKQTRLSFDTTGTKMSVASNLKRSKSSIGKTKSKEHRENIAKARKIGYDIIDYNNNVILTNILAKDVGVFCRSLMGKTEENRLGSSYQSKAQLNKSNNLHLVGYYTRITKGKK